MRDVHGYSSLDNLIDHREKNLTELEAKSAQLLEKYFGVIAEGKGNFVEKPPSLLTQNFKGLIGFFINFPANILYPKTIFSPF